jgi:hypothetical protein
MRERTGGSLAAAGQSLQGVAISVGQSDTVVLGHGSLRAGRGTRGMAYPLPNLAT